MMPSEFLHPTTSKKQDGGGKGSSSSDNKKKFDSNLQIQNVKSNHGTGLSDNKKHHLNHNSGSIMSQSSGRQRSHSFDQREDFIEELRRYSEDFDRVLNEMFSPTLENDLLEGDFSQDLPAVYISSKPQKKKREWLSKLFAFRKQEKDELYSSNIQKSSSMEEIWPHSKPGFRNSLDYSIQGSPRAVPTPTSALSQHTNYSQLFDADYTNHVTPIYYTPNEDNTAIEFYKVSNKEEVEIPTHLQNQHQSVVTDLEQQVLENQQPNSSHQDFAQPPQLSTKPALESCSDVPILGVGLPFEIVSEMGTNNICLKLQGEKRIDSSMLVDALLIVLGSLLIPPLLLFSIPFALYRLYKYLKKKGRERSISRYIIFDHHSMKIEKRLYTSGQRKILYKGCLPRNVLADEAATENARKTYSYYHESSPENTHIYKQLHIVKMQHTHDHIDSIDFSEIASFDVEKETQAMDGNGHYEHALFFVCCVLKNGRKFRLNNEETNSIDIAYKKARQLKAAFEKSKLRATHAMNNNHSKRLELGHKRKSYNSINLENESVYEGGEAGSLRRSLSWSVR
ncbi:hypothetical protein C9374_004824 [Naegleria lovaniensis]|uniref:Uncharacterized protein n=1 Tax=Naegleria lovaniensis TaxID=51637 RepID=A0AA88GQW9_NAELO|nr:uncharacterized protein C9374_004824 [Naegleria lovaniensis]KAG2382857.1 hypothetical protein C9374_004824 [Naegleria lovaniensis]